jgi:nucleoside 2-deoxyribosyltransferase
MKLYLASPLGFSPEYSGFRERIKEKLRQLGCQILDPWDSNQFAAEIAKVAEIISASGREEAFRAVARMIGHANELMIREADILLAVLDGLEVDSGTASEVGFASALGKRVYGLRTDWRDSGDFPGLPFNLQVVHFITSTGGRLFRSIDEIAIERRP